MCRGGQCYPRGHRAGRAHCQQPQAPEHGHAVLLHPQALPRPLFYRRGAATPTSMDRAKQEQYAERKHSERKMEMEAGVKKGPLLVSVSYSD